ncbi:MULTISPECIES: GNAT family N-acetyltransferase [Nostocales]|uniref:Uncharacterized protein n=3 Tax=Nostocales TaxID=1161 RepID=A0A8S9T9A3_9CYAN|nr:GNAT family N-acetyltransferase [Tolypothrix bouteillei]KAF3888214.1 hypothetical protein DA73_0400024020 [Tolypothrix bouteillei VB521301]
MNIFNYIIGTSTDFRIQLIRWNNKCREYINTFYSGDIHRIFGTRFGDCVAKVEALAFSGANSSSYRGVTDNSGILQAAAIISIEQIEIEAELKQGIIIESLTNAPWNVIEQPGQDIIYKRKGAATSLIEGIIGESQSSGFGGIVKVLTIERAKEFYQNIGFRETDYSRELIVTEYIANTVLSEIKQRRQLQPLD